MDITQEWLHENLTTIYNVIQLQSTEFLHIINRIININFVCHERDKRYVISINSNRASLKLESSPFTIWWNMLLNLKCRMNTVCRIACLSKSFNKGSIPNWCSSVIIPPAALYSSTASKGLGSSCSSILVTLLSILILTLGIPLWTELVLPKKETKKKYG